jgi:uncharacterized membrane protein HdeD (DUF308 family)
MTDQAKEMLTQSAPWRRGVAWPVILIEGLVALGIGIYILAQPDDARDVVRQLLGAVLLVNGLLSVLAGFRRPQAPAARYLILRGAVGATVGLIITLEPISDYLESDASRFILALGALAYGLLGLVQVVATREEAGLRIGPLIVSSVWIVLAILFFTGDETDNTRLNLLGIVLVILGLLLCAYAYYLYRVKQAGPTPAADQTPEVSADPTADVSPDSGVAT